MDYQEVKQALFEPASASAAVPAIVAEAAPARKLRDAIEPVAMHAVWSPLVHERMAERGLDFFQTYVWGRACVLGEPNGAVVASAFAAFPPEMIGGIYDQARANLPHAEAVQMTVGSTAESLRSVLEPIAAQAEVQHVASQLAEVVDQLDGTGRPLFTGAAAMDWSDDTYGKLWQASLALREHRGDAHVNAYVAGGFNPVQMNMLTEAWLGYPLGEYSGTRAWPEEVSATALASLQAQGLFEGEAITDKGRQVRAEIEAATDAMEQPVVDALGANLEPVSDQLAQWSEACVAAQMFPPDPRKRAAG